MSKIEIDSTQPEQLFPQTYFSLDNKFIGPNNRATKVNTKTELTQSKIKIELNLAGLNIA